LEFDPFKDVDYTKEHEGESDGTKNVEGSTSSQGNKSGEVNVTGGDVVEDYGRKTTSGSYTDTGTDSFAKDSTTTTTASSTGSKGDRYSDTPQGTIHNTDVVGNAYLTNVRLIDDTSSGTGRDETYENNVETRNLAGSNQGTESTSDTVTTTKDETNEYSESNILNGSSESDETIHNTDSYVEHVFGKMSSIPYSELLQKFRDTFLNIDMMVIDEFDELFLRLW